MPEDFGDIPASIITRIEQNKIRVNRATREALARRLNVEPREIQHF